MLVQDEVRHSRLINTALVKLGCSVRFEIQYGEWLALYRIPTGILHAWNHYTKLSMLFQAQELCMVSLEKKYSYISCNCRTSRKFRDKKHLFHTTVAL